MKEGFFIKELKKRLGNKIKTGLSIRKNHSHDESYHTPVLPDAVLVAETTQDVSTALEVSAKYRVPVTAFGSGSSLEGNPIPIHGGLVISFQTMNRIVDYSPSDFQVVVEPGIVYEELNKKLRHDGLFFPPGPGSAKVASIGGMVNNNSSGMRSVKYGVTKDYVLGLEVVLADGKVINTGTSAFKSSSGYDLTRLFVGSEGTLGLITKIRLRLRPLPETRRLFSATFESDTISAQCASNIILTGIIPSALEMLDDVVIDALNHYNNFGFEKRPTLLIELDGNSESIEYESQLLKEVLVDSGAKSIIEYGKNDQDRIWDCRREARHALQSFYGKSECIIGDVCVPISQFGKMISFIKEQAKQLDLIVAAFGHAGDGNVHTDVAASKNNKDEWERAMIFNDRIVNKAIELGGTITGEHGVGIGKKKYIYSEHNDSVSIMKLIKSSLDPQGILNPSKIF